MHSVNPLNTNWGLEDFKFGFIGGRGGREGVDVIPYREFQGVQ